MTTPSSDLSLSALIEAALGRSPAVAPVGEPPALDDGARRIALDAMVRRNWIDAPPAALAGRNILLLTRRPFSAALALCALHGLARRIVLCPPDVAAEQLPMVIEDAGVEAIVHDLDDRASLPPDLPAFAIAAGDQGLGPRPAGRGGLLTEWALFTSGTTGRPKMALHGLAGLTHAITPGAPADPPVIWSSFYDIRRYGGLQMLLRALTGGHAMLLTTPGEPMADFLTRLKTAGATHVSGTPSHWRAALMNPALAGLSPAYVRLSGEIADQSLLDRLAARFPRAAIGHAYASTEAGVGFEVTDGLEGFPAAYLTRDGAVEMRVEDGTLRIRSPRAASAYLGAEQPALAGADGFVDTGDLVERRGDRLYFMGRASGVINVGGLKVHPEEVEAVINRCPGVRMALVEGRPSPITGAVVAARVVLDNPQDGLGEAGQVIREHIMARCRAALSAYKVPASVRFVDALPITVGGKLERRHA